MAGNVGIVDDANSSTKLLGIDEEFTGEWTDLRNFASVIVSIKTDKDSAINGLHIEHSSDGVNIDGDDRFSIVGNGGKVFTFMPNTQYYRIHYINSGTAQGVFRLQVNLKRTAILGSSHRIQDSIKTEDDAELVKAILTGQDFITGIFENIKTFSHSLAVTNTDDYLNLVLAGKIEGVTVLQALGERENIGITAAGEDVWYGTTTTTPVPADAGEDMYIVSDNDEDGDGTSTGILTINLHYLDANGVEQEVVRTMAGQTPVAITGLNIRFIQEIHAETVGSNGVAIGNITIYQSGDAARVYSIIKAGGNQSLVPSRMVPFGKKLYLRSWQCSEAQGKRAAFRIRSTDDKGLLRAGVFHFKGSVYLNQTTSGEIIVIAEIPAFSIVKVSAWALVSGGEGSCSWWGYLIDD